MNSDFLRWNFNAVGPMEAVFILFFIVLKLIFFLFIVMLVVRLLRRSGDSAPRSTPGVQILEERYARGEITQEEFLERRAVLRGGT
ncbi:MAG: hypothetical protein QOG04_2125 [Actinomycetota bacterium]|jgi:uncharacterized membrane protein|nr:hypothetical protein [Actinomycetota bacterium]